ncbi:hypothetical protein YC2023_011034 [Brassica napus]
MSQTIKEADTYTLVEYLAQSNGSNGSDYDRTTRKNNDESHHAIQELNAKMDKILKRDQKMTVDSCQEYGGYQGYQNFGVEGYEEPQEELNYLLALPHITGVEGTPLMGGNCIPSFGRSRRDRFEELAPLPTPPTK